MSTTPAERTSVRIQYALAAIVIVWMIGILGWMQQRDEAARATDTVISTRSDRHLITALHECPPASPDMTETLILIVHAPPAGAAQFVACARMAKRQYMVRR